MRKRSSITGRPEDESQLAKSIVDELTIDIDEQETKPEKNPAAVMLGRLGGQKGGKARAEKMTEQELAEWGRKAAQARWSKKKAKPKKKKED
jgi:hypothetical protein